MSYKNISGVVLLNANETKYIKFNKNSFIFTPIINITSFNNDKFILKNITKHGFEILNCSNNLMKLNYIAIQTNKININKIKNLLLTTNLIEYQIILNENQYLFDLNSLILEKNPNNENILFEIYELPNDGEVIINNNFLTYTKNQEQIITFKIKAKLENYPDIFQIVQFNISLDSNNQLILTTYEVSQQLQQYENYSIQLNDLILSKIPQNENVIFETYESPQSGMLFIYDNFLNYTKDFNFQGGIITFKIKAELENHPDIFKIINFNLDYEIPKYINLSNNFITDSITNNNDYILENLTSYIQYQYPENEQILIEINNNPINGSLNILNNNLIYSPNNNFIGTEYFSIKYYFENFTNINEILSLTINISEPIQQFEIIDTINISAVDSSFTALKLKYNHDYISNTITSAFSIPNNDLDNNNNYFSIDLTDNTNTSFYIILSNSRNQNLYYISDINNIESTKIQKGPISYVTTYNSGAILPVGNKYYFWFNSSNNSWYYSNESFPFL